MTIDGLEPIIAQTITVDGVEIAIRSIDELSRLDSYQEMNDYEIRKLMDYQSSLAATRARNEQDQALCDATVQAMKDSCAENYRAMRDAFDYACSVTPALATVEG